MRLIDDTMRDGTLYWITGLSGAGKTTIGNELYYKLKANHENVILLDGDVLKGLLGSNAGYSKEERHERAFFYSRLCKMLTDQGMIVICCTIAMFDDVREWNSKHNKAYIEVFLDVPYEVLVQRDQKGMYSKQKQGGFENLAGVDLEVELPKTPHIRIVNDGSLSVSECVSQILEYSPVYSNDFKRDTDYWNMYYLSDPDIEYPSLFAESILSRIKDHPNKSILELGCGNGRDSIFFACNGYNVTAIDASDKAIARLQMKCSNIEPPVNLRALCDDFVCSRALFMGQYDYCYSRFSLHAINEEQETLLISNVYNVLKHGGEFFIEVRSIHDPLYGLGEKMGDRAYKYNGHYRRFLDINELNSKLEASGFNVVYSEESDSFAPFGNDRPPVIRIIAKKEGERIVRL